VVPRALVCEGEGSHRREEVSFCVGEGVTWRGPSWLVGFN
jgi:hypothetical protein